jgi:hypothetical protein
LILVLLTELLAVLAQLLVVYLLDFVELKLAMRARTH